jgi:hypothetical protein
VHCHMAHSLANEIDRVKIQWSITMVNVMDLLGFLLEVYHLDGADVDVWGLDDLTIYLSPIVSCKIIPPPPPSLLLVRSEYSDRAFEKHRLQWQSVGR